MLNKKNIAIAMAAATVAMPMSQSFAATAENDQTQDVKVIKEKVLNLLNLRFTKDKNLLINNGTGAKTDVSGERVFTVSINGEAKEYTSYAEFERAFDEAYNDLKDGETLKVNYHYAQKENTTNNPIGYTTLANGAVVDFDGSTYDESDLDTLAGYKSTEAGRDHNATNGEVKGLKIGQVQYKVNEDTNKRTYEVRLTDGKKGEKRFATVKVGDVTLALGDIALDATNPTKKPLLKQVNGNYVDIDGNAIGEVGEDDIVTFVGADDETYTIAVAGNAKLSEKLTKYGVVDGFLQDFTDADKADAPTLANDFVKKGSVTTTVNASELFNKSEGKVTSQGNELLNRLQELKYNLNDVVNTITVTEPTATKELKVVIEKQSRQDKNPIKVEEIRIVRDAADKNGDAYNAIKDLVSSKEFSTNVTTAANYKDKIAMAAGADRYATAAQISRKAFTSLTNEKAVVLVTGEQDKLVDGLTATPLAAALNGGDGAPVLLTGNTKLAQPVVDEINRLKAEKVYIVGGAISDSVVTELERHYGMKVERISGDDRYETSLAVADELHDQTKTDFTDVFVAGGKSEADALSAGAAAAALKAPILLTSEAKLTKDVKYFIGGDKVAASSNVYVVGGSISKDAYSDIVNANEDDTVKRLSGDNRQDTNAEVIEEFFTGNKATIPAATKVVVAKSDNKGMVDALGAGLYAGKMKAPVVLATNSLTEDQEDALNNAAIKIKNDENINKIQIGEGIASAVIKFIKNL